MTYDLGAAHSSSRHAFTSGLRKIEAARVIAEHMVPARNTSPSFCCLRDALRDLDM